MNKSLLIILILLYSLNCAGQQSQKNKAETQQSAIRKQVIVSDLENQVKDLSITSVRVFIRFKLASWLWREGKDETEEAEQLTVKAIDELYEKKNEIPKLYFNSLSSDLFALIETNAPQSAKKLREKYQLTTDDDLENAYSLLDKKNGKELAIEKLKSSLMNQTELSSIAIAFLEELQKQNSPKVLDILMEIISLEESGKSNFSADSLSFIVDHFRKPTVPNNLRVRFYRISLRKAIEAIRTPDSNIDDAYDLLFSIMDDISANAPDLLQEASTLMGVLKTKVSRSVIEENEIYERIENSQDKLGATISEADSTDNKSLKRRLLISAARLALEKKKFRLAVDLVERALDEKNEHSIRWHDQFLGDVSQQALKENDMNSSKYASEKIIDKLSRAEVLRKMATYFYEKKDLSSATDTLDESLKLTSNEKNGVVKIRNLFRLILSFQKINRNRVPEITETTAKAIDAFPTPNPEDKPDSENYQKYVSSIMAINWNLVTVVNELLKDNRSEAISFANRLNRKEVKIAANFGLLIDSLNIQTEPKVKSKE